MTLCYVLKTVAKYFFIIFSHKQFKKLIKFTVNAHVMRRVFNYICTCVSSFAVSTLSVDY